jgi:hypothetical protein
MRDGWRRHVDVECPLLWRRGAASIPPHCFHVARQRARNARWSYRVRISAIVIFLPPCGTARIGVRPMGAFRHPYQSSRAHDHGHPEAEVAAWVPPQENRSPCQIWGACGQRGWGHSCGGIQGPRPPPRDPPLVWVHFAGFKTIEDFDSTNQSTLRLSPLGLALSHDIVIEGHCLVLAGESGRRNTHCGGHRLQGHPREA